MRHSFALCLASALLFSLLGPSLLAWSGDSFNLIIASDLHFGSDVAQPTWTTPYVTHSPLTTAAVAVDPDGIFANWNHTARGMIPRT